MNCILGTHSKVKKVKMIVNKMEILVTLMYGKDWAIGTEQRYNNYSTKIHKNIIIMKLLWK